MVVHIGRGENSQIFYYFCCADHTTKKITNKQEILYTPVNTKVYLLRFYYLRDQKMDLRRFLFK